MRKPFFKKENPKNVKVFGNCFPVTILDILNYQNFNFGVWDLIAFRYQKAA